MALSIHQFYQLAKRMSAENRQIEVWSNLSYLQAREKSNSLPEGFVVGSAVVAEDNADPSSDPYCDEHACFYGLAVCSVCEGDYL